MINQHEISDKQLLAWDRERTALQARQRHPPVHLLTEPIQRGWKRHFLLTQEARVQPDAAVLAAILEEIDTVVYHWGRDFQPSRRQLRASRRMVSSEQFLRAIAADSWDDTRYPEHWQKYFCRELVPRNLVGQSKAETYGYRWGYSNRGPRRDDYLFAFVFRYPRLFVLTVERHWLTHIREVEPGVEARLAELEVYISRHDGNYRLGRLRDRSCRRWNTSQRRQKILHWLHVREMRGHQGPVDRPRASGAADAMPSSPLLGGGGMASAAARLRTAFGPRSQGPSQGLRNRESGWLEHSLSHNEQRTITPPDEPRRRDSLPSEPMPP